MIRWLLLVGHQLRQGRRGGVEILLALGFFALTVSLFPLGLGPGPDLLARIAPAAIWAAALLAALLSMERLFQADADAGVLDGIAVSPLALSAYALGRAIVHWLTTGLALLAAAPVLALMLGLPAAAWPALIAAFALGTPSLSLIGSIGAALIVGARRAGMLLVLVVLPLFVPVLVFGVAAVEQAAAGRPAWPHLMLLAAILVLAAPLAPLAAGAALRQALK